jgi:hypothetical protein
MGTTDRKEQIYDAIISRAYQILNNLMEDAFQLNAIGCVLLLSLHCPITAENTDNEDLKEKITKIINYGSLAPSTHNAQMWRVKIIAEDKIQVLLDPHHILPQVDPQNRESLISLGAFIENMVEAAPYFGLQPEVSILT